jgi:hypothetical protein
LVLAGQRGFIEHFAFFTRDKSGVAVDTGDEASTVSGNGEAGIGEKFGGDRMRRHVVGALETNDFCNGIHRLRSQHYILSSGNDA